MSELTRRINNELEKEQLKSEQLSNVSVTAQDLLGIASNNDKVLLGAIDNAYDSVNANPTLANIDNKMKGLMEIKPQAVLNETKTYFNVAINNLNSQKELLAQKNNAIADIYDQIDKFDATDKDSASSVLNMINQGVRTGLLTSEQLTNARKAVTDKFDAVETDRKLVEIDNLLKT